MKIVSNYDEISPGKLQETRLYLQGRPLVSLWRKKKHQISYNVPSYVTLIDQQLTGDYIAIDCGGWYFSSHQRSCTAIELQPISKKLWHDVIYEYDYLTWWPDYLPPNPVLAYYSTYFKYSELSDFVKFLNLWGARHPKLVVGLDPTKLKYNYLKHDLVELITTSLDYKSTITVLERSDFHLLFTLEKN